MLLKSEVQEKIVPIQVEASERIRRRLIAAGKRFHSNDNIADFIRDGEQDELLLELEQQLQGVLRSLIIDTQNDHNTAGTAKRVARMFLQEVFRGRYEAAPPMTTFPNVSQLNELMVIGPVTVRSACSHHLCPILGKVWLGVLPNAGSDLVGLSKFARLTEWIMSRPQIQEEAVVMLANELEQRMRPDGLAIVMEAAHFCMQWRGVKDNGALMRNSIMRGSFLKNAALRGEFLSLIANSR